MADLLEYLSDALHCSYLSDLHFLTISSQQAETLLSLAADQFSLEDYQRALNYLKGSDANSPKDLPAARKALAAVLTARKPNNRTSHL